jgi:hypothetical protein
MVSLGAATFCWNGNIQDYCFLQTIASLIYATDQIAIHAGGTDGTYEDIVKYLSDNPTDKKVILTRLTEEEWKSVQGQEKLSVFSNVAIDNLDTDFFIYVQCDEVLDETSYPYIREAIKYDVDAYFVRRWNMWKDDKHILNVEQNRKPCSDVVIRLARRGHHCVSDAESLGANNVMIFGEIDLIQIWHVGYIRDKVKHLEKIRHVQTEVFLWGDFDVKAKDCTEFQPERWFSDADLLPIPKPLPVFIQAWAEERYPKLK